MNKLKKMIRAAATLAVATPLVAFAQWSVGQQNAASGGTPDQSIWEIIRGIMNWLLGILGFIAIVAFVIAGILYLTAAGDEGQIEKAKSAMVWSIVGVIVALLGYIIVRAATAMLGGQSEF